jgi:pyruvate,water dikinase
MECGIDPRVEHDRAVIALADAAEAAEAGGKAANLARLVAAGLPVPEGFVVTAAAFTAAVAAPGGGAAAPALDDIGHTLAAWAGAAHDAELPPALVAEVEARARALAGPLAVRSSMALEDRADRAGAGLGRSLLDVATGEVWPAIRAVWASALTPLVVAYARGPARPPAVIVQRMAPGRRVAVYTRAPGRPAADELWLDDGGAPLVRTTRAAPPPAWAGAIAAALAAERAIGATTGADVELVIAGDDVAVVQARPLVHPPAQPRRTPPPPALLALLRARPRRWRRDATHNPDPLSPAQAGLCERIEAEGRAPFHLAVVAGHLYGAPREPAPPAPAPPADAAELEARFATIAAAIDAALATPVTSPAAAIDVYLAAYHLLTAELAPLVAAGRAVLVDALRARGLAPAEAAARAEALAPGRPSSLAAVLARAARGELDRAALDAELGELALAWDVAAPTLAEQPALVDAALARARARPPSPTPPTPPADLAAEVALARAAADAAERDDRLFARAQAVVRHALRAHAIASGVDPDDIFWIPLADALADAPLDPERTRARAAAARAAAARAAAWDMPLSLDDQPAAAADRWQGVGVGRRAAGPAHRVGRFADATRAPRGAIVVTAAVTPALAIVLEGAAAIACEHGSILDHGAAMARELGIPCVVGCPGLTAAIADGDWLELDGEAGTITRRP